MHLIIYEVVLHRGVFETESLGLFFRGSKAVSLAKKHAKERGWKLIKSEEKKKSWTKSWGESDDWGMLEGIQIVERTVVE